MHLLLNRKSASISTCCLSINSADGATSGPDNAQARCDLLRCCFSASYGICVRWNCVTQANFASQMASPKYDPLEQQQQHTTPLPLVDRLRRQVVALAPTCPSSTAQLVAGVVPLSAGNVVLPVVTVDDAADTGDHAVFDENTEVREHIPDKAAPLQLPACAEAMEDGLLFGAGAEIVAPVPLSKLRVYEQIRTDAMFDRGQKLLGKVKRGSSRSGRLICV